MPIKRKETKKLCSNGQNNHETNMNRKVLKLAEISTENRESEGY